MKRRCRAGDLAIIIKEEPGCEANIGRLVRVSGPILVRKSAGATWLISPVAGAPWSVIGAGQGGGTVVTIARTTAQLSGIEHPDRWMVPLRDDPTKCLDQRTADCAADCAANCAADAGPQPASAMLAG